MTPRCGRCCAIISSSSGLYRPFEASTLDAASGFLEAPDARFDAIILDINLPDGDGRDFCARVRTQGHTMPVIMLTGATDEEVVISSLNAGAHDYIAKPFRANELLARLRAQLRLFDKSANPVYSVGPFIFRPAERVLIRADTKQRVSLTLKEVDLIKFFYRHDKAIVSRKVLLDEVWGYNASVDSHTLETHIYRLRQKIEDDPKNCRMLMTVDGGYQLDLAEPNGAIQ